mmetsp:Transcript_32972/g.104259  ORF Transcript_32972/g.104259 Transcript_32972/m.104259 type:complete len:213 (-) Transcript_32972:1302-1940(-)
MYSVENGRVNAFEPLKHYHAALVHDRLQVRRGYLPLAISHQVAIPKHILGIHLRLDPCEDGDSSRRHLRFEPLLAMLSDTMVMREGAAKGQDLLPCLILNLREESGRILEALGDEAEVEVDTRARIICLSDSARNEWLSLNASSFACSRYPTLHALAENKHIAPWHGGLEGLRDEVISYSKVSEVGDHKCQEVSSEAILLPCVHPPVLCGDG